MALGVILGDTVTEGVTLGVTVTLGVLVTDGVTVTEGDTVILGVIDGYIGTHGVNDPTVYVILFTGFADVTVSCTSET